MPVPLSGVLLCDCSCRAPSMCPEPRVSGGSRCERCYARKHPMEYGTMGRYSAFGTAA